MRFTLDCKVFGIPASQWWDDLYLLGRACEVGGPFGAIVEIGTYFGGLSLALALHAAQHEAAFATFDITPRVPHTPLTDQFVAPGCIFVDVFTTDGQTLVRNALAKAGERPALLVCDGGNKPKEVQLYAPTLKAGDWLAVHDFGSEISEADIPTCLVPALDSEMAALHAYAGDVPRSYLRLFTRA